MEILALLSWFESEQVQSWKGGGGIRRSMLCRAEPV